MPIKLNKQYPSYLASVCKVPEVGEQIDALSGTGFQLKSSIRLVLGDDTAMSPGKADLLDAIIRTGSISAGARSMDMSYRRAWLLVDEMNRCFKRALVETSKGGSNGGGARLTPFGKEVLGKYRLMQEASRQVAAAYMELFRDLASDGVKPSVKESGRPPCFIDSEECGILYPDQP